jgi:hypothetical protein
LASLRLQKKEFDLQSHHVDGKPCLNSTPICYAVPRYSYSSCQLTDPTLDFSREATLGKNDLKFSKCFAQVFNTEVSNDMQDKDILPLVKCFIENGEL